MKIKKFPAQIMIIVLIIISVLSIVALTVTLTTVRDTKEQVQNKQYEQYYTLGEQKIMDMQQKLGTTPLPLILPAVSSVPFQLTSLMGTASNVTGSCVQNPTPSPATAGTVKAKFTCDFPEVSPAQSNAQTSAESSSVTMTIEDYNYIKDFNLDKDQDLLIDLTPTTTGEVYLYWPSVRVAWSVSLDYYTVSGSTYNYFTDKGVINNTLAPTLFSAPAAPQYMTFTTNTERAIQNLTDIGACVPGSCAEDEIPYTFHKVITLNLPVGATPLSLRIRPLIADGSLYASMSLTKSDYPTALMRKITSYTTSSATATGSGNTENPTTILETKYLLASNPSALFDYVLRTEQGIVK